MLRKLFQHRTARENWALGLWSNGQRRLVGIYRKGDWWRRPIRSVRILLQPAILWITTLKLWPRRWVDNRSARSR